MIRPKNFRELRKSIITQKEKSIDKTQHSNIDSSDQEIGVRSFKKISLTSIPPIFNDYNTNQNFTPNYVSPIRSPLLKKDTSFKQNQSNYLKLTPNKSKANNDNSSKKKLNDGFKTSFLQFDGQIKKKLNFHHLPQKFVKERLSSKKKDLAGPISFKNIIQNSPSCRQTERQMKAPKQTEMISKYAESERQTERKSSLTKLKYQFAGIKKNIEQNIKQMSTNEPIFSEIVLNKYNSDTNNQQVISFTKKIVKKNGNSQIFKEKAETKTKNSANGSQLYLNDINAEYYNPFNSKRQVCESLTDQVNISADSILQGSSISDLDMSPCL